MKSIICEIKKSLYIPFFGMSCLGVVLVCLLSEGYTSFSGKNYTIIELLLLKRDVMLTDVNLNRYEIWNRGIGTWTQLLLPFLLSIGYLYVISSERQTGMNRLMLIREGNVRYGVSKVVSAMFSGGCIMLAGYVIFGLIVYAKFPSIYEYATENINEYMQLYLDFNESLLCFERCIDIFIYGMSVNAFTFLVAILFTDKYILLCLPVMLKYIWGQVILKVQIDAMNKGQDMLLNLSSGLRPENILNGRHDYLWGVSLVFMFVVYMLGLCLNIYMLKKKGDDFGFE